MFAAELVLPDPIRAAPQGRFYRGLGDISAFPIVLRQDGIGADHEDEIGVARAVGFDGEKHLVVVEQLDAAEFEQGSTYAGGALVAQRLHGENDVFGGERLSVMPIRAATDLESELLEIVGYPDALGQATVMAGLLVDGGFEQAIVNVGARAQPFDPFGDAALVEDAVEAIERSHLGRPHLAARRSVRVHIVEVREVGRVLEWHEVCRAVAVDDVRADVGDIEVRLARDHLGRVVGVNAESDARDDHESIDSRSLRMLDQPNHWGTFVHRPNKAPARSSMAWMGEVPRSRRGGEFLSDIGHVQTNGSTTAGEGMAAADYRNYADAQHHVRAFYRDNHAQQTYEFAQARRSSFARLDRARMGIWAACEHLDAIVDDSDPDTNLTQIEHCLQTAEGIRRDGHPDWFVLAGLVHDLGKVLVAFGEPQWAVTGDTFVVGCEFPDAIVYPEYFAANPDTDDPRYASATGVYEAGCGLDALTLSWGHDEYMYLVARDYLPPPALAMIRYHSFYPGHSTPAYHHLMNAGDRETLDWVRRFNAYDLYTKHDDPPDVAALRPYYEDLIARYFPAEVAW